MQAKPRSIQTSIVQELPRELQKKAQIVIYLSNTRDAKNQGSSLDLKQCFGGFSGSKKTQQH